MTASPYPPEAVAYCSNATAGPSSASGDSWPAAAALPAGYMPRAEPCTAVHLRFAQTIVSTGRSCIAIAWWHAAGLANR